MSMQLGSMVANFGSMRTGVRQSRFVQYLVGLTKHISCFGFANNKKRSIRGSLFEMFCFTMAFGSFVFTAIMIWFGLYEFDYLSNWDTAAKAYAELDLNWWEYLNILLLIVGIFWPAYIRERDARIQFSRQGAFSSRIMISLNCCALTSDLSPAEQSLNDPNLFYMRTLTEEGIATFFPDEFVQMVIDKSKRLRMRHGRAQFEIREKESEEAKLKAEQEEEEEAKSASAPTTHRASNPIRQARVSDVPDESHVKVAVHAGNDTSFESRSASSNDRKANEAGIQSVAHRTTFAGIAKVKVNASKIKKTHDSKFGFQRFQEYKAKMMDGDYLDLESKKRDTIASLKPLPAERPGLVASDFGGLDRIFFFDPIMTIPYSYRDRFSGMLDHVRNNISKMSTPGHLRMDANLPSVCEEYVFAVLCEDYKKKTTINAKLRIALVRRVTLNKIGEMAKRGLQPDWEVVRSWNGGLNNGQLGFFKKRWLTLVHMFDQLTEMEGKSSEHEAKTKRRLLSSVSLTFPVQGLPKRDRGTTFAVVPEAADNNRGIGSPERLIGVAHMDSDSESDSDYGDDEQGRDLRSTSDVTVSSGPGEQASVISNSVVALKMALGSWVSGSSVSIDRSQRRGKKHRSRSFN